MSYFLLDSEGNGGDFASSQGVADLALLKLPALAKFLETGEADQELADSIKSEVAGINNLAYMTELFSGAAPFVLTNGIEEDDVEIKGGAGSGNWAHSGRPGLRGGSGKDGGEVSKLIAKIKEGGFTFNPITHKSPTTGFVVALPREHGMERVYPLDKFKGEYAKKELKGFLAEARDGIKDGTFSGRVNAGAWVDSRPPPRVVLDVSEVYKGREGAINVGIKREQDAIYDLKKHEEIDLRGYYKGQKSIHASSDDGRRDGRGLGQARRRDDVSSWTLTKSLGERISERVGELRALKGDWSEELHPRDSHGRFGAGGATADTNSAEGKTLAVLKNAGLRVAAMDDMPAHIRSELMIQMGATPPTFSSVTEAKAQGIVEGLRNVQNANIPGLNEELSKYSFVFTHYGSDGEGITMTTVRDPNNLEKSKFLLINTSYDVKGYLTHESLNPKSDEILSVMKDKGVEAATKLDYVGAIEHESGHVFDFLRDNQSTERFVTTVGKALHVADINNAGPMDRAKVGSWLEKNISSYASQSSSEASADAFEMMIEGRMPKELEPWKNYVYSNKATKL